MEDVRCLKQHHEVNFEAHVCASQESRLSADVSAEGRPKWTCRRILSAVRVKLMIKKILNQNKCWEQLKRKKSA